MSASTSKKTKPGSSTPLSRVASELTSNKGLKTSTRKPGVDLRASTRNNASGRPPSASLKGKVNPKQRAGNKPPAADPKASTSVREPQSVLLDTQYNERVKAHVLPTRSNPDLPMMTSDPLQVAAQFYAWTYMTSTLESTFKAAESSAKATLERHEKEVAEQEADVADQRLRCEAEKTIEFCNELLTEKCSHDVPDIVKAFLTFEKFSVQAISEASQLSTRTSKDIDYGSPLLPYDDLLSRLATFQAEAKRLTASISQLLESEEPESRSQVLQALSALLPVIRTRADNLSSAQELVTASRKNLSLALQLESLQLSTSLQ